jgi:hypothetical protein
MGVGNPLTLSLVTGCYLENVEGKVLYHEPGLALPPKYHLFLGFNDGSALTIMTAMWGAMELY